MEEGSTTTGKKLVSFNYQLECPKLLNFTSHLVTDGVILKGKTKIPMNIKVKNESICNFRRSGGVYLIRCIPLERIYIGSTRQNFRARFSNHCKFLNQGRQCNSKLLTDFKMYGSDNFEFEILEIYNEEDVHKKEQVFIDKLKPYYNTQAATKGSNTNIGRKFTSEHIEKLRQKSKNFKHKDLESIAAQNKKGANKFIVEDLTTGEKIEIGSKLELRAFFKMIVVHKYYNKQLGNHFIHLLQTQKKSVSLLVNDQWIEFQSFEKCDKFLDKWRGYTSTKSLKNVSMLDGYPVKFNS